MDSKTGPSQKVACTWPRDRIAAVMNDEPEPSKKNFVTWPRTVVVVVLLGVAGILIWQLVPSDSAVEQALPALNNTQGDSNSKSGDVVNRTPPTEVPSTQVSSMSSQYQFFQCEDLDNCCNGLEGICDFGVDEILWGMSHNAMSSREDGYLYGANHIHSLEGSLVAGYRGINLDVCNCGGEYQLCQEICDFGIRYPTDVFFNVMEFLNDNPTEVIMLNLKLASDVDLEVNLDDIHRILQEINGFTEMLYIQDNATAPWPTLRTLIDSNKRILLFHFGGPSTCANNSCPPGMYSWFEFAAETESLFSNSDELLNVTRSCGITHGGKSSKNFFAVNNFVTEPDEFSATIVNSRDFLENRIDACSQLNDGLDVNVVYVDFWSTGDLPKVVQDHNKALAQRRKLRKLR